MDSIDAPSEQWVAAQPESDLAPLLAAWDLAHPAADDPGWRHVLDEMVHPFTTQALKRLAG